MHLGGPAWRQHSLARRCPSGPLPAGLLGPPFDSASNWSQVQPLGLASKPRSPLLCFALFDCCTAAAVGGSMAIRPVRASVALTAMIWKAHRPASSRQAEVSPPTSTLPATVPMAALKEEASALCCPLSSWWLSPPIRVCSGARGGRARPPHETSQNGGFPEVLQCRPAIRTEPSLWMANRQTTRIHDAVVGEF